MIPSSQSLRAQFREPFEADYSRIAEIYNYFVLNTTVTYHQHTFEPKEIPFLLPINHKKYPTFVVFGNEGGKEIIWGFCALKAFSTRESYARTAEIVLYLDHDITGKGIGPQMVKYLEKIAPTKEIKVLIAVVSSTNHESITLFSKMGYEKCGILREVGEKFGQLLDSIYFQKIL